MSPWPIIGLLGAGVSLLLFTKREPEARRVNIAGHQYRIYQGENYLKVVREYNGKDVLSVTCEGPVGSQVYTPWVSPEFQTQPDLFTKLGCESAQDIRDQWQQMGLPPQVDFKLPSNCFSDVAGEPPFLFVYENE